MLRMYVTQYTLLPYSVLHLINIKEHCLFKQIQKTHGAKGYMLSM